MTKIKKIVGKAKPTKKKRNVGDDPNVSHERPWRRPRIDSERPKQPRAEQPKEKPTTKQSEVISNVQKRLYSDDEPLKAKISSYGNTLKAIETIKSKLTVTQIQEFQKTCFGHFLNMQKLEHQGHVIHHLGLSMVECDDDTVMEFNFGGTGARFTDRDFALITGLNFNGDIKAKNIEIRDIRTNNIHIKYLNKSSSIWTYKLFKYFEDADYEEDKDAVKMALLYFLNCGLLGVARKTNIDMNFVSLVEDLDKFNQYPWGVYLYKLTIQALNGLFGNLKVRNASGTCDIKGFPLAFQVWAYEAIPKLGEDGFAKRVKACMPRILGWKATDHPSYKELKDTVFGKKNYEVLWTLIPSKEELKKEYMTPWKNGHRKRRCRAQPIVEQYQEEPVVDTAANQSVPAAAQSEPIAALSLPSTNDHNHTNMGMILGRLDGVEQRLDTLQRLCLAIFEKLSSQERTRDPPPPRDPSPSPLPGDPSTPPTRDPSAPLPLCDPSPPLPLHDPSPSAPRDTSSTPPPDQSLTVPKLQMEVICIPDSQPIPPAVAMDIDDDVNCTDFVDHSRPDPSDS